jgi:hypothetical protein
MTRKIHSYGGSVQHTTSRMPSAALLTLLVLMPVLSAVGIQQGHPMEGTWQGFWGETANERNFLTLILRWNGEEIVGGVNPGPNSGVVRRVELDSSNWMVRFDLEVPDRLSGDVVRVSGEGRLFDIGSPRRILRGSLEQRPESHFTISRQ